MARHDDFRAAVEAGDMTAMSAVEAGDMTAMSACFTDDATFHSPAVFEPYVGRGAVATVLDAVTQVFEDFTYTGAFVGEDGRELLEFHTRVGDKDVQGVDVLTFDDETGLVTDLTVLLRPLRGLEATVARMGALLAAAGEGR